MDANENGEPADKGLFVAAASPPPLPLLPPPPAEAEPVDLGGRPLPPARPLAPPFCMNDDDDDDDAENDVDDDCCCSLLLMLLLFESTPANCERIDSSASCVRGVHAAEPLFEDAAEDEQPPPPEANANALPLPRPLLASLRALRLPPPPPLPPGKPLPAAVPQNALPADSGGERFSLSSRGASQRLLRLLLLPCRWSSWC